MEKFYEHIVKRRKIILVLFILLAVLCTILQQFVGVNYDMNDYLPSDAQSTVALEVMQEEFAGGIPNTRVMVKEVTIPEALEYKERLEAVEGVAEVTWLDDSVDITTPFSLLDKEIVENYYQEECALFSVTIEEDKRIETVEAIREVIREENAMTGSAVSTALATTNTISEIQKITIVAIIFVLLVLVLTTSSWIQPVIILLGLGAAILLNSGTNLIFGEISFVTNAAGAILQLAVSLDYSVFLLHRYEECRKGETNEEKAMVSALCKSTSSILSSGLTTVIGFLALVMMRFRLGPDLGLALAKGIAISLVTVFLFMPALILAFGSWMEKTGHREFIPSFTGFGKLVRKLSLPMVGIFCILILPAYLASNANSYYYGSSQIYGEGTVYGRDSTAIEEIFGKSDTYVLLVPKGNSETERRLSDELKDVSAIKDIISYVDTVGEVIPESYLAGETLSLLKSENYSCFVLSVEADYEGTKTVELVKEIKELAEVYYPGTYHLAGEGISTYDLMETITADMVKVNLLAIGAVFVVLLFTMKSLSVPVILVLSIETAIWINLSIP